MQPVEVPGPLVPVGRGQVEDGDALGPQPGQPAPAQDRDVPRAQDHGGAGRPRREDLLDAGVEADGAELHDPVAGAEPVEVDRRPVVVYQAPVGEQHPVGPAGGPRGVDHVAHVLGPDPPRRGGGRAGDPGDGVAVEPDEPGAGGREAGDEGVGGEDGGEGGVVHHEGQALRGERRIEGDARPARLQDPEQADGEVVGALDAHADKDVGAHAFGPQVVGQPVGSGIELGIAQRGAVEDDRRRLRCALGLRLEQIVLAGLRPLGFGVAHQRGSCSSEIGSVASAARASRRRW